MKIHISAPRRVLQIYRFWIALLLLGAFSSIQGCTSFRDARAVVALADSLDLQGRLYADTAALNGVIATLNTPIGKTFSRTDLAKAWYYLGRLYDDSLDCVCKAADCYIACDRLRADDYLHRGRANTCMAYICMRQRADDIALVYCQRASDMLRGTRHEWFYAHSLLNMCSSMLDLGYIHEADSVWSLASAFATDSAYIGRLVGMRGSCLYAHGEYDSALVYIAQSFGYPLYEGQRCFYNMQRMQIHSALGQTDSAACYARYIVAHSQKPAYLAEAYGTLIRCAQADGDADALAHYIFLNEDNNRILRADEGRYALAVNTLQQYIHEPYPFLPWQITIAVLAVLLFFFWLLGLVLHRHHILRMHEQEAVIAQKEKQLKRQEKSYEKRIDHITRVRAETATLATRQLSTFLTAVNTLHNRYPVPPKEWVNDYPLFKRSVEEPFLPLIRRLEQIPISQREIYYCVYIVLYKELTSAGIADALFYSPSGIRTFKQRAARKLGTKASAMYDTLLCMAVSE